MIRLNSERGIVSCKTWEELETLTGFQVKIDPAQAKFKEVIGSYTFKDKAKCGLTCCRTPHNKGFIVETEEGLLTNVGRYCGKNRFGLDFNESAKAFIRLEKEQNARERLYSFTLNIDDKITCVNSLINAPKGASWLNKQMRLFRQGSRSVPPEIVKAISDARRNKSPSIKRQRLATSDEASILRDTGVKKEEGSEFTVEEGLTTLAGLEVLYKENDLQILLVHNLQSNLISLREADIDSLSPSELKHYVKWASDFEIAVSRAESIITAGRKFFTFQNLSPLERLASCPKDKKAYLHLLNELPK